MYTVPKHKYFIAYFSLITTFAKFIGPSMQNTLMLNWIIFGAQVQTTFLLDFRVYNDKQH